MAAQAQDARSGLRAGAYAVYASWGRTYTPEELDLALNVDLKIDIHSWEGDKQAIPPLLIKLRQILADQQSDQEIGISTFVALMLNGMPITLSYKAPSVNGSEDTARHIWATYEAILRLAEYEQVEQLYGLATRNGDYPVVAIKGELPSVHAAGTAAKKEPVAPYTHATVSGATPAPAPTGAKPASPSGSEKGVSQSLTPDYFILVQDKQNRVSMQLWCNGRKHPEMTLRIPDHVQVMLTTSGASPVLSDYILGSSYAFPVGVVVQWKQGNKNPAGNGYYKDFVGVSVAEQA